MATPISSSFQIRFPEIPKDEQSFKGLPPRRYPPVGPLDTVIIDNQGRKKSIHGTCNIFKDEEIIEYHPVLRKESLGVYTNSYEEEDVYVDFTQNEKAIIQQQATRGCIAATAAMLIKDQKKEFSFIELSTCNLGNDEDTKQYIRRAGLKPMVSQAVSLEDLKTQLSSYGSAIVSISDPQAGGHSIVVDEVSEDLQRVRLRDPYHGWEITVSAAAFQLRWGSNQKIIQIEEGKQRKSLPSRRYPPVAPLDKVRITEDSQGRLVKESLYGTYNIFKDEEIIEYHPVLRQEELGKCTNKYDEEEDVYIDFTRNDKAIIQQQSTRACVAATAAMLIKDQKKEFSFIDLSTCSFENDEDTKKYVRTAGLEPIVTHLESNSLEILRKLLGCGSAIVSIWDPQANHRSIIVDEVSEDLQQVRLRDPYHGWEITVSAAAFQLRWKGDQKIIQIRNEKALKV